jgi:hypothetical protein
VGLEAFCLYNHLVLASEATNEYHRPLAEVCLDLGVPFGAMKSMVRTGVKLVNLRQALTLMRYHLITVGASLHRKQQNAA